jgi:hypothetical protein
VRNRRVKKNRWLFVVVACATLAAGASLAEDRGGTSSEVSSSLKGLPAHASESGGGANKSSQTDRTPALREIAAMAEPRLYALRPAPMAGRLAVVRAEKR